MKMGISAKIVSTMLVFVVLPLIAVAVVVYLSLSSSLEMVQETETSLIGQMQEQANRDFGQKAAMLSEKVGLFITARQNDLGIIAKNSDIPNLFAHARDALAPPAEEGATPGASFVIGDDKKKKGVPVFVDLADRAPYDPVISRWKQIQSERPDILMIRALWKNGAVLAGVIRNEDGTCVENRKDYKGHMAWFRNAMNPEISKPGTYRTSAISISRRLQQPVIRYTTPIEVDGERLGVLIIVFHASAVTESVQLAYGEGGGEAYLVDPAYENAEG